MRLSKHGSFLLLLSLYHTQGTNTNQLSTATQYTEHRSPDTRPDHASTGTLSQSSLNTTNNMPGKKPINSPNNYNTKRRKHQHQQQPGIVAYDTVQSPQAHPQSIPLPSKPYQGNYKGFGWNAQALMASSTQLQAQKGNYLATLINSHDF